MKVSLMTLTAGSLFASAALQGAIYYNDTVADMDVNPLNWHLSTNRAPYSDSYYRDSYYRDDSRYVPQPYYYDSDSSYSQPAYRDNSYYRGSGRWNENRWSDGHFGDGRSSRSMEGSRMYPSRQLSLADDIPEHPRPWDMAYGDERFNRDSYNTYRENQGYRSQQRALDQAQPFRGQVDTRMDNFPASRGWENRFGYYDTRPSSDSQRQYNESMDQDSMQRRDNTMRDNVMRDTRDGASTSTDRQLLSRIQEQIDGNNPDRRFQMVVVQARNGTIILAGALESEQDRQELKNKINKVEGVRDIEDRLSVRSLGQGQFSSWGGNRSMQDSRATQDSRSAQDSSSARTDRQAAVNTQETDRQLNQKARDALQSGLFSKGYENVSVDIHGGRARLSGNVDSESDKKDVLKRINDIDGIKGIEDNLRIVPRQAEGQQQK